MGRGFARHKGGTKAGKGGKNSGQNPMGYWKVGGSLEESSKESGPVEEVPSHQRIAIGGTVCRRRMGVPGCARSQGAKLGYNLQMGPEEGVETCKMGPRFKEVF